MHTYTCVSYSSSIFFIVCGKVAPPVLLLPLWYSIVVTGVTVVISVLDTTIAGRKRGLERNRAGSVQNTH